MVRLKDFIWLYVVYYAVILGGAQVTTPFLRTFFLMLIDIHTHVSQPSFDCIFNADVSSEISLDDAFYSVGIHPWYTDTDVASVWTRIQQLVAHPSILALGETGIDKLRGASLDIQQEIFANHIMLSEQVRKPLIIHCVKGFNELLSMHKHFHPLQPWVVHGFRNNWNIAQQLLSAGLYLSFGERFNAQVVSSIPLDRLFVETDESSLSIVEIIQQIADCRGMEARTLHCHVQENIKKVFFGR